MPHKDGQAPYLRQLKEFRTKVKDELLRNHEQLQQNTTETQYIWARLRQTRRSNRMLFEFTQMK